MNTKSPTMPPNRMVEFNETERERVSISEGEMFQCLLNVFVRASVSERMYSIIAHLLVFFTDFEIKSAVSKIRLEPGSRLAAKFPHLVKAAAPT